MNSSGEQSGYLMVYAGDLKQGALISPPISPAAE